MKYSPAFSILFGAILQVASCETTRSTTYAPSTGEVARFVIEEGKYPFKHELTSNPHSSANPTTEPILFQIKYSAPRTTAETLLSIDVRMVPFDAQGKVGPELKCAYFASRYITQYYYYDAPGRVSDPAKPLNSLLFPDDRNTPDTINYFYIDRDCKFDRLPETIEQYIVVKWTTRKREFKTTLKRKEIYTAPTRPRPYG
ncbi:MAG: hypothetical protein JNM27_08315 [Leptospirales bacterium]|nr:hypothetical protein [Leptospirales bacterium]